MLPFISTVLNLFWPMDYLYKKNPMGHFVMLTAVMN